MKKKLVDVDAFASMCEEHYYEQRSSQECPSHSWTFQCPACDEALELAGDWESLVCHTCHSSYPDGMEVE